MQQLRIILFFETTILLRNLCTAILCPVPVGNAVLSSTCSRQIGYSCSFSCTQGYVPTTLENIVCTSDGTWNLNTTTLCSHILSASFILVTDYINGQILQIDLQTGTVLKLPISVQTVPGLAFDKLTKTLFFSDTSTKSVSSTTLNGEKTTLSYYIGSAYADRLAIDYSTGNLYYTAVGQKSYIGVVHRITKHHKTLIGNLSTPRDIALYPSKGFLFWTEFGSGGKIGRANMDGTSMSYISTLDLDWPNGLTIDYKSSILYWTDGKKNRIEYSDLNGGNRQVLAYDSGAHLMGIVIHEHYLFYTAWQRKSITKIDKRTGLKVTFMSNYSSVGRLDSLVIYADDFSDVSSSCLTKNGLCSTFCFPTSTGRNCGCQDNVTLLSDELTCEGAVRCPILQMNLNFTDCHPYPGSSCDYKCKAGYRPTLNTTVFCNSSGKWSPPTDTLCEAILYCDPVPVGNAVLSSTCSRQIGNSCSFSCIQGYVPTTLDNILCTYDGTWNLNTTTLCSPILCPVPVGNAVLSSTCSRQIGNSCSFSCIQGYVSTTLDNILCTSDGTWNLNTTTLCSLILCPVPVGNAVLSSTCSRNIGDSCSFSCIQGYVPTTLDNILCTTDGTWNLNTTTLCSLILCPVPVGNAVLLSTCSRNIGDSCSFSCIQGYVSTTLDNILCTTDGTWNLNTTTLCSPILCPKSVGNVVLSPNCTRVIGESCTYSCTHGYFPTTSDSVVCTSEGSWNTDIMDNNELCSLVHCPLDVINGNTSSSCRGLIGEKCYVICDSSINIVDIVCLSSGSWDKDTTSICSLKNESVTSSLEASKTNMLFLYAGTSVAGTLVVVTIIVGVACLKKRRDGTTKNANQGMPSKTESSVYFVSVNSGYEEPEEHVYCEIVKSTDNAV